MKTEYVNIYIKIDEELYDLAYGYISQFQFTGIEERSDELIITFESKSWNDLLRTELIDALKNVNSNIEITKEERFPDKNWNEEWEKNVEPVIINDKIVIAPSWKIKDLNYEIPVIINPKMSFGTGEHASTRLVCKLMETVIKKNSFWIDAGTGTGVLAILALKLGAGSMFAFDNNEWSIENAKENFILNSVENKIELLEADIESVSLPDADGITANLFRHLLIESFPVFYQSLNKSEGDLIVSGILKYDENEIKAEALHAGFIYINLLYEDEWVGIHFKARGKI
jgi:ribosomal protein L11 methyltransferase